MHPYRIFIRFLPPTLLCCLFLTLLPAWTAAGITPDLEAHLQTMGPEEAVPVIVTFADDSPSAAVILQAGRRSRSAAIHSLRAIARTRRQEMAPILHGQGATRMRSLWLIDALAVTATPDTIRRLAAMDGVADVRPDRRHHKKDVLMALTDAPESNITQVGAPPHKR